MHDSRIGAFGAIRIVMALALWRTLAKTVTLALLVSGEITWRQKRIRGLKTSE